MRTMLVVLLSLCLISGIAIAKPALEKPVKPFEGMVRASEVEPNDTCAEASVLTLGDPMLASIDPAGDVDWFEFTAEAGQCVVFETHLGDGQTGGDTQMTLYADDCITELAYDDDGGYGLYSMFSYEFVDAGVYFIYVNEYGNNGTIAAYVLTADACPEPPVNPTCETAIDLQEQGLAVFMTNNCMGENTYSPTNYCTGYSSANGEDIVYKIDLVAGEVFTVALTDETYDAAIYMLADCGDMDSCVAGGDDPEEFSWTCDVDGTYYLIIDGYSGCGEALVTIDAPIANDDMDWGTVKSLFR